MALKTISKTFVAVEGAGPKEDDFFSCVAVETDLEAEVGVRMVIVQVAPFVFFEKFDKNFFIIPGWGRDIGVLLFVAHKLFVFFFAFIGRSIFEIGNEKLDDFLWLGLQTLYVKVDFTANHVLRGLVEDGVVGIGVMGGATMPTGDDDLFPVFS